MMERLRNLCITLTGGLATGIFLFGSVIALLGVSLLYLISGEYDNIGGLWKEAIIQYSQSKRN